MTASSPAQLAGRAADVWRRSAGVYHIVLARSKHWIYQIPKKGAETQILGVNSYSSAESSEGIPTKSEELEPFLLAQ